MPVAAAWICTRRSRAWLGLQRDGNPCEAQGQLPPALDGFQVDEHAVLVPQRHASLAAKHGKANIDSVG